jgi:hypothetical protein
VEIRYDKELDALVMTIDEDLSFNLYKRVIDAVMQSPHFRPGINVLYDIRRASARSLSTSDIHLVSDYGKSLARLRGPSWKAAILVSGIVEYGLGRMFEMINIEAPFEARVFRREEDAREWLQQRGNA